MMKRGWIAWLRSWIMSTLSNSSGESAMLKSFSKVDTDGRLHANGNPEEDTFSLSTHMVHRSIIAAGREWTNLRIQEVQGKFLCPPFLTVPHTFLVAAPAPNLATAKLTSRWIPMSQLLRTHPIRSNSSSYPPPFTWTRTQQLPRSTANGFNPHLP